MDLAKQIRFDILEIIFKVDDVKTLETIRHELEMKYKDISEQEEENNEEPLFMKGVKPIRENVTLKEIMAEQDYKPVSYKEFRELADKIEWEESLDELLEALSK